MMNAFAAAARAQFYAPGSAAAIHLSKNGTPVPIRAIRSNGDEIVSNGGSQIVVSDPVVMLLKEQVPDPQPGDLLIFGGAIDGELVTDGEPHILVGDATGDIENTMWTVGIAPHR